ncbi:MAG: chemotaxis protein CheW [Gammaproteobacteria bacterium]|nr:chemotaxis protein CheW [Gammaproteobacteria bacterium]MBU1481375.1 chemotaxis protein CheW [Gammaproteobacteria bacterium]
MSIDMSQFYQVFFEESAEHLANMESLLLALDLDAPDPDQLNAIFRAAHSIKGGSGTFGFTDMTEVTHVLETLLDRIRKNEIAITSEMVDAFLLAGDVLRGLLEAHQNGSLADEAASLAIREKLQKLTAASIGAGNTKPSDVPAPTSKEPEVPAAANGQYVYQIRFVKNRTNFKKKEQLDNLLQALRDIGTISNQKIESNSVSLTLISSTSEEDLREAFMFFIKPEQLTLTVQDNPSVTNKSKTDDELGYGFFVDPENLKSDVENAQGYGFFVELENQPQPAASGQILQPEEIPQRRATDKAPTAATVAAETSIRVSVEKVDQMINLVGELVITQAMLAETVSGMDQVLYERLINGLAQLDRNTRDLQESVMSVRMMPINFVFSRFPRVVRDLASKLEKKVQLKTVGEGTELDKGLIEKISDPLTHLVRNSLDHGIELPEERIAKGKDPQGTITLRAAHQGGNIVIEVEDDGAGLNREKILAKAREKGIPFNDNISDADVWLMIFAPGFSTAEIVTDVSGRGVGMDVVKRNIDSIAGRVEITSRPGQGCTVTIRLPLTLAILDGLSIAVGEQTYIVPLSFISESLQPGATDIKNVSGQGQVVLVRGEYVPMIALHQVFNIKPKVTRPEEGILVLLEAEGKKVALFVDELVGQHQVVIKSLETNYRKVAGMSGATIMGDGRVAMIMDVPALVKLAQQ